MPGGVWRALVPAVIAAAALAVPAEPAALRGTSVQAKQIQARNGLEAGVLAEINALRRRHGLRPLRASARLRAAADAHSAAMARHGFFRHSSRDGSPFWRRIERYYGSRRYAYWAVGENLLWSARGVDPAGAVEMWLESPRHRKVLLTPRWREIGLSAVHAAAAPGAFRGRDVIVLTADFGVRG